MSARREEGLRGVVPAERRDAAAAARPGPADEHGGGVGLDSPLLRGGVEPGPVRCPRPVQVAVVPVAAGHGELPLDLVRVDAVVALPAGLGRRVLGLAEEDLAFTWPLASFALVTAAFAAIFKLLPSAKIRWSDVLPGAVATALLFTAGRALIAFYLARAGVSTAYGAAGSLVAFLVWVYASAQILLFGAELTQVWTRRVGSRRGERA